MKKAIFSGIICALGLLPACSGDDNNDDGTALGDAPESYTFDSRFQDGDGVSYTGQTLRHVLIADIKVLIDGLEEEMASEADFDPALVEERLLGLYEFDSDTLGDRNILMSAEPALFQTTYNDVSDGKNLLEKMAGQDGNDHKDFSTEFAGWEDTLGENDVSSPDKLVRAWFKILGENAQLQVAGDASREGLTVFQTAAGQDLAQLTQKFLLGAIAFSQGADDYLDEGLASDNVGPKEDGSAYTSLEHAWDEAFGYFGAARDYLTQSDSDIADGLQSDANEDEMIDLTSEFNFGASVNAAKRDNGSMSGTDFTSDAMSAFLEGRHLISNEGSAEDIQAQAELAVEAWEKAISSTCVHYINDTLGDHALLGEETYSFGDHAKHWSELKGFALSLQFNPRSPLSSDDFVKLHQLIGDAPVLEAATEEEKSAYGAALLEARDLLADAYEFEDDDAKSW